MSTNQFRWIYFTQFGCNMWLEPEVDAYGVHAIRRRPGDYATDYLRFDEDFWKELSHKVRAAGANTILFDVGEGLQYQSHPELAVKGSWSAEKLHGEIKRLREMGFEVLPKLNFSAGHDQWLGEYSRMLSTSTYYKVVKDVIREVAEVFERPALFHLGMDEETAWDQRSNTYIVIRQGEQWWHDLNYLAKVTEEAGCRPWIWSDYGWHHEELFFQNMSREIVQSNWYYNTFDGEDRDAKMIELFDKLDAKGYDQIPTGSTWLHPNNLQQMVEYCNRLNREHLMGYIQTSWKPTMEEARQKHDEAVEDLRQAVLLKK